MIQTNQEKITSENCEDNKLESINLKKSKKNKKNKKPKCNVEGCKGRIVALVGHCKWCNLDFCQEHRIPEAHMCIKIDDCKKDSFDKNQQLNSISCQFKKIEHIESY
tara:strand:+ start:69 stop:389 length:321 start_codon:yes stop_codon:yes gene_type:complete